MIRKEASIDYMAAYTIALGVLAFIFVLLLASVMMIESAKRSVANSKMPAPASRVSQQPTQKASPSEAVTARFSLPDVVQTTVEIE